MVKVCLNPACPHRTNTGTPASFRDTLAVCSDCGEPLFDEPTEAGSSPAATSSHRGPRGALLVTLLLGVVPVLARELPLPVSAPDSLDARAGWTWTQMQGALNPVNSVTLSLFITALAAALVSRWNHLRIGPEGLARLTRRGWLLAALLFFAQCVALGVSMRSLAEYSALAGVAPPPPALTFAFNAALFALLFAVGRAPSRVTLVSPLFVAMALSPLPSLVAGDVDASSSTLLSLFRHDLIDPRTLLPTALATAVIAWATWRHLLRERAAPSLTTRATTTAYRESESPRIALALTLLPVGVGPVMSSVGWSDLLRSHLNVDALPPWALPAGIGALAALAFAWLAHQPARTGAVLQRLWPEGSDAQRQAEAHALRRHAMRWGVGGTVAMSLATVELQRLLPHAAALAFPTMLLTAATRDALRIYRARAAHGPLATAWADDRMYVAAPAVALLAAHGIPAVVKNLSARTLFPFFAIYAPLEVLVPLEKQAEARALCEASLAG